MTMDEMVKTLQEEVQALKKETHYLKRRCNRLSHAKLSDPKYPYDNWLLTRQISEDKNANIMRAMSVLESRLKGKETNIETINDQIPKTAFDLLYHNNKPSFEKNLKKL